MSIPLYYNEERYKLECTLQVLNRDYKYKLAKLERDIMVFKRDKSLLKHPRRKQQLSNSIYCNDGSVNYGSLRKDYTIYPVESNRCLGSTSTGFQLPQLRSDQEGPQLKSCATRKYANEVSNQPRETTPPFVQESQAEVQRKHLNELAKPKFLHSKHSDTPRHPGSILTLRNMDLDDYEDSNALLSHRKNGKRIKGRYKKEGSNFGVTMSAQVKYEKSIKRRSDRIVNDIEKLTRV